MLNSVHVAQVKSEGGDVILLCLCVHPKGLTHYGSFADVALEEFILSLVYG